MKKEVKKKGKKEVEKVVDELINHAKAKMQIDLVEEGVKIIRETPKWLRWTRRLTKLRIELFIDGWIKGYETAVKDIPEYGEKLYGGEKE